MNQHSSFFLLQSFFQDNRRTRGRDRKREKAGNFKSLATHEIPVNDGMIPLKTKKQTKKKMATRTRKIKTEKLLKLRTPFQRRQYWKKKLIILFLFFFSLFCLFCFYSLVFFFWIIFQFLFIFFDSVNFFFRFNF